MKDGPGAFRETVEKKARRRLQARREADHGVWFGFGLFGLVGWTVAIPTVAGLALGAWIDSMYPGRYSWTIMGLLAGAIVGCVGAWRWVKQESRNE